MSRIKLLPENSPPASGRGRSGRAACLVVKELVENSIDAGARAIEVGIAVSGGNVAHVAWLMTAAEWIAMTPCFPGTARHEQNRFRC